MKYLSLILIAFLLVGCGADDPWRNALASEHAAIAANSQAQTAAQINQAQQSQTDARNAQELLQTLQAQQAIVAAQAAQAQAQSQTAIVASNNEALVLVADKIADASRTDYTPLYAGMAALVIVAVVWIVVNGRKNAMPTPSPRLLPHDKVPVGCNGWLLPDGRVQLEDVATGRNRLLTVTKYEEVTGVRVK